MKTEKGAVGGKRSRNKTKRENWLSGEWQRNGHKHTQEVTNSTYKLKDTRKKDLELNTHPTSYCETLRPDSLGREHLLLTADSVLGRKNYRTVSVLSSAAVFFSLGFKDLQGVWGGFEVSHKVLNPLCLLFCLLFYYSVLDEVKRGKIYKKQGSDGSFSFYTQLSQSPYCALHNKINFY